MNPSSLSAAKSLLGPMLAMVALAYASGLSVLLTRMHDVRRGRDARFYENYTGGGPPAVERTTRQLANVFEFPVLFLAAACLACACGVVRPGLMRLAWVYAVLRWVHAIVHLTPRLNRTWLRASVFFASNVVLLVFWVTLARIISRAS